MHKSHQGFLLHNSIKTLDLESTPGVTLTFEVNYQYFTKVEGIPQSFRDLLIMKIAEVSEHTGISSDTLRYYERIGLIWPVNRNASGIRNYTDLDLRRVEFIKCMRSAGLPVEVYENAVLKKEKVMIHAEDGASEIF